MEWKLFFAGTFVADGDAIRSSMPILSVAKFNLLAVFKPQRASGTSRCLEAGGQTKWTLEGWLSQATSHWVERADGICGRVMHESGVSQFACVSGEYRPRGKECF